MIEELQALIDDFPGQANQTRCFDHVTNLVAKTITAVFDAPKKRGEALGKEEELLAALAQDIELEEDELLRNNENEDDDEDDDIEGWIDEQELLSEEERRRLNEDLVPIRLVVVKVCPSSANAWSVNLNARSAQETRLQDHKLVHKVAPSLEESASQFEGGRKADAERCANSLEFNISHARLCNYSPEGT